MSKELISAIERASGDLHDIAGQLQEMYDRTRAAIARNDRIAELAIREARARNEARVNDSDEAPAIEQVHAYESERYKTMRRCPSRPVRANHLSLLTGARVDHKFLEREAINRANQAEVEIPPIEDAPMAAAEEELEENHEAAEDERKAPSFYVSKHPLPRSIGGVPVMMGESDDDSGSEYEEAKPKSIQLRGVQKRHGFRVGDVVMAKVPGLSREEAGIIKGFAAKQVLLILYSGEKARRDPINIRRPKRDEANEIAKKKRPA